MWTELHERFAAAPIVPLISENEPAHARKLARALGEGGLTVLEVVMRHPGSLDGMKAILSEKDALIVGAGTVLDAGQARMVIDAGAEFLVSPGLDEAIARLCEERGVPYLPGTMTPGEVQRARALGLDAVKFFPASLAGGPAMLKALSAVFGNMRFMPTGGISPDNLKDYLALESVLACGGSWLTPPDATAQGDWARITGLAREAVDLAREGRA
ncbi:MAG: bifunctional 4-hydroxy-2-oxoglutarate aldolase/2-dehydro-3-deoxy-phosphogluconate aldolase [Erythrobacter sp.]